MTNMDTVTIQLDNQLDNQLNDNSMNIAIITNSDNIIDFYDNQINKSGESLESGFDLVVTEDVLITKENPTVLLPLGVKCAPNFKSGYYLYPRSSIFKTPLRMANSIGIIDQTYRGEIKAPVDYHCHLNDGNDSYLVKKGTKLFQLCKPDLSAVKYFKVNENELSNTIRGNNGFGSSGQFAK
jgi:dUTP pyrophosphatase